LGIPKSPNRSVDGTAIDTPLQSLRQSLQRTAGISFRQLGVDQMELASVLPAFGENLIERRLVLDNVAFSTAIDFWQFGVVPSADLVVLPVTIL